MKLGKFTDISPTSNKLTTLYDVGVGMINGQIKPQCLQEHVLIHDKLVAHVGVCLKKVR